MLTQTSLNEGRGINPGDTEISYVTTEKTEAAQRRPGHQPRRHRPSSACRQTRCAPLNEGRGINPGDT